jgi:hypothetical protein
MDYAQLGPAKYGARWRAGKSVMDDQVRKSSHFGGKQKPGGTVARTTGTDSTRRSPIGQRRWVSNGKSSSFKLFSS